uniref:Uncharacterized protein n=1 Tax=viral metagenome TaxID=1070528 RepID=A0A6C0CAI7_9ZZZZ
MSNTTEIELFTVIFLNISIKREDLSDLDINSEIYIKKFYDMLSILKKNICADNFVHIFNKFCINDNAYYNRQIENLSDNLRQTFNATDKTYFYLFMDNVQSTIIDELLMIYHRCILFPHEKEMLETCNIQKKIISSLLTIINAIHEQYKKSNKKRVEKADIQNLLDDNSLMNCLVEIISNRSVLMNIMYDIFLITKSNKIAAKKIKGIKCTFFPLKVFSVELFILEHLLDFLK